MLKRLDQALRVTAASDAHTSKECNVSGASEVSLRRVGDGPSCPPRASQSTKPRGSHTELFGVTPNEGLTVVEVHSLCSAFSGEQFGGDESFGELRT